MKSLLIAGTVALAEWLYGPMLAATPAKNYKPATPEKTESEPVVETNKNTDDLNQVAVGEENEPTAMADDGVMPASTVVTIGVEGAAHRKSARRAGQETCPTDSPRRGQKKKKRKARRGSVVQVQARFVPPTVEPTLVSVELVPPEDPKVQYEPRH